MVTRYFTPTALGGKLYLDADPPNLHTQDQMEGIVRAMMGTHKRVETTEELHALIAESNERVGSIRIWLNEMLILDAIKVARSYPAPPLA